MIELGNLSVNYVIKVFLKDQNWIGTISFHTSKKTFLNATFVINPLLGKLLWWNICKKYILNEPLNAIFVLKYSKISVFYKIMLIAFIFKLTIDFTNFFFFFFAYEFSNNFLFLLQLTVIHPQQPQEPAKVSSSVDIQLEAKDSHFQVGVHGVEQPSYSVSSSDNNQSFFVAGAKDQSKFNSVANSKLFC